MTDEVRARLYERYASTCAEAPTSHIVTDARHRAPYLRRFVERYFPGDRRSRIVDLGCGSGTLVRLAREAGYQYIVGIDRSPEQVWIASQIGVPAIEEGDVMDFLSHQSEASWDAIVTFDVIEHLRRDELLLLVDAILRVLVDGGRWVIHCPNAESPFFGRVRYGDFTHELAFTRSSLSQLLLASGFRSVQCYEDRPIVHGPKSAVRALSWMAIRSMLRFYLAAETGRLREQAIFSQNMAATAVK